MSEIERVIGYRSGSCRNEERALSHTYAIMENGDLWPMCGYGWNRSDGTMSSTIGDRRDPGPMAAAWYAMIDAALMTP